MEHWMLDLKSTNITTKMLESAMRGTSIVRSLRRGQRNDKGYQVAYTSPLFLSHPSSTLL